MDDYNYNSIYGSGDPGLGDASEQRKMYPDYCGPNTASRYYGGYIIGGLIFLAMAVLFALLEKKAFLDTRAPFFLIAGVVMIVYGTIQFLYYRKVVLTYVQEVIPQIATPTRKTMNLQIRVTWANGTTDELTKRIYYRARARKLAGQKQIAGYDPNRKQWILI